MNDHPAFLSALESYRQGDHSMAAFREILLTYEKERLEYARLHVKTLNDRLRQGYRNCDIGDNGRWEACFPPLRKLLAELGELK